MSVLRKLLSSLVLLPLLISIQCNPVAQVNKKIDKAVNKSSPDYVVSYVVSKYKLKSLENDTVVYVRDSIIKDTMFVINNIRDTIFNTDTFYISKDKLRIKVIRQNDTIRISGLCVSDTVYRYKTVYVEKPVLQPKKSWLDRIDMSIVIFIILCIMILYGVNRFFKNNF